MWVLSLSYYDDSGSFYRSKFIIYKDKEKAEEEGNKEIENQSYTLKSMLRGDQSNFTLDQLISFFK